MTKKCKHIFTHWRVKLLKILLQDTVHGRTLHGFKQKQVPGRFCEDEKTKSRCQIWQAMRTNCQVAARLGCAMVGQRGKLGQPPPSAAWSHCAWNQWAEPGWGWWPTLLCRSAGMGWPQGQARAQVGEVGAAEFKADVSVPGAWVLPWHCSWTGAETPDEASPHSSSPCCSFPCCHLGAGLGLAGKWRMGCRANRCTQNCGTIG